MASPQHPSKRNESFIDLYAEHLVEQLKEVGVLLLKIFLIIYLFTSLLVGMYVVARDIVLVNFLIFLRSLFASIF